MNRKAMNTNGNWLMRLMIVAICLQFSIINSQFSVCLAQPKARRVQQQAEQQVQQQKKSKTTASSAMTRRAQISFPTALDVPEDVVWRRDIYREILLEEDANAGLYYPVQPQGKQVNLFTYIFKLAQNGYIPIYEYSVANDGQDDFSDDSKVSMKTILDNFRIFYEEQNGKLKVDNSDIPSGEVKKYYLKESAYYDQANSSFHIKVLALCPVMMRDDDFAFSDENSQGTAYPLFWVKYSDLEPFLTRQTVMTSSKNNAALMSMDDFFTMNKYKGKIYKTTNMLGKTLAQICEGDTARLSAEQKRIEQELEAFRKNIFGDPEKKDSLDSIANANPQNVKAAQKAKAKIAKKTGRRSSVGSQKNGGGATPAASGSARVSVRRQRH